MLLNPYTFPIIFFIMQVKSNESDTLFSSQICNNAHVQMIHEEEDMDIPEFIEEIIELLLSGLRDSVCF